MTLWDTLLLLNKNDGVEIIMIYLFIFLSLVTFLCMYSGVDEESNTMKMMKLISRVPGIKRDDLFKKFGDDFLDRRFIYLKKCGFLKQRPGKVRLTKSGLILVTTLKVYRKMFKLSKGG